MRFLIPSLLLAFGAAAQAQIDSVSTPINLRGYGVVSGNSSQSKSGSVLTITAADIPKAQLVQAKFLSDLASLPGVSEQLVALGKAKVPVREIRGQGVIAVVREGVKVRIFSAPDAAKLVEQFKTTQISNQGAWAAEVKVPMWLDRWDKYGFRFYYRTWDVPKGKTSATHDYLAELDYAKEQNGGLVIWNNLFQPDNAEGMMDFGWWEWAQREAKKRQLPVGINSPMMDPIWLLNSMRDQTQQRMPGFSGNYHRIMSPHLGGQGTISWNSQEGQDAMLGTIQQTMKRFSGDENITTYLEPHGELYHGNQDIFLEYGPVVDANYRRYLQATYKTPEAVAKRWGTNLKTWNDVRLPEIASFAGWGPEAIDVSGDWRVGYEELLGPEYTPDNYPDKEKQPSKPAPAEWFADQFDDSSWPEINTQADDRQFYTPKRPAVFRRSFDVPAEWKAKNQRVWLYVWDMNVAKGDEVRYFVNGQSAGSDKIEFNKPHWEAVEVTSFLRAGKNTLALRLPQGYIAYRTYLSPVEPKQYPNLGAGLNAQWVDFADFTQWSRLQACKRGMEMIRQIDPNRQITLMHPDEYSDGIKNLALAYGGNFHNTGWMGAFWGDYLNSVMRGAGLPFSLEPGGPAADLAGFKKQLGLWQTEGIQGIDYFIHIGSIYWNDEIRKYFEANRKQLALLGKYHYERAETAVLYSDRMAQLTRFPWGQNANTDLGGSYWNWNAAAVLRGTFPYDGLTQGSFASGDAAKYRVIFDSNTSIMDEKMVTDIENWVRNGGTFVTLAQTGRHTPDNPNSWPISRLTGYNVTKVDAVKPDGRMLEGGSLKTAPGQTVFGPEFNGMLANGLHLQKAAPEAQDLLLWNDGSVAAGCRKLGNGIIVQLGAKFTVSKISDRLEPGGISPENQQLRGMLSAILRWRDVKTEAGRLESPNDFVMLRPAVTNNGLYDVWTLWNQSKDQAQTVSVVLAGDNTPQFVIDARDGSSRELKGNKIDNIVLEAMETRVFLTPRRQLEKAPQAWFALQREWWRGTTAPDPKPFKVPEARLAQDLSEGWKFKAVAGDVQLLMAAEADDTGWTTRRIGIWNAREEGPQGVFRKRFTVPAEWKNGRVSLSVSGWNGASFLESGRVSLDGRELKPNGGDSIKTLELKELVPGTSHVLAIQSKSSGVLAGLRGQVWLAFEPAAEQKIDLAGSWQPSKNALQYGTAIPLPGPFEAQLMRRNVTLDSRFQGRTAMLTVEGSSTLVGALVNGKLVRRHHHLFGERWSLNVTPYLKYGQENRLELVTWGSSVRGTVREVSLNFYAPQSSR